MDNNVKCRFFLIGPMGAGKSTVGARLAERLGLTFYDLDALMEERTGASIATVFDREGEAGFRRRESELLDEITQRPDAVVATGGGCVMDRENRRKLRKRGFCIYLATPVDLQLKRLRRDRERPLLQVRNRRAKLDSLQRERDPLYRETAHLVVEARDVSPDRMTQTIIALLEKHVPNEVTTN